MYSHLQDWSVVQRWSTIVKLFRSEITQSVMEPPFEATICCDDKRPGIHMQCSFLVCAYFLSVRWALFRCAYFLSVRWALFRFQPSPVVCPKKAGLPSWKSTEIVPKQ